MILDLDDPRSLDPRLAGGKGSWLARGRQAGLPILPGLVVTADASHRHMELGAQALVRRGSGGARLEVGATPLGEPDASELHAAAARLAQPLVVRSSTLVEAGGAWSGAFTSYVGIAAADVEVAVRGCWAAAFTVSALQRQAGAAIAPGTLPMAVVVQPAVSAAFGGTARIEGPSVVVVGVAGSPAPLLQGWEPGVSSWIDEAGRVVGDDGARLMGVAVLRSVASSLRRARELVGATACEWAIVGGDVVLLQLAHPAEASADASASSLPLASEELVKLARVVRRAPGPLGEALVLPWAVAAADRFLAEVATIEDATDRDDPRAALEVALRRAGALTARIWGTDEKAAFVRVRAVLRGLRSSDPRSAIAALRGLAQPDPTEMASIWTLIQCVRQALVGRGAVSHPELGWHVAPVDAGAILSSSSDPVALARIGVDRWEPFLAQVVLASVRRASGVPSAAGIGCGRLCVVADPAAAGAFRPRDVIVARHPVPMLGALLWDAAAIVTTGGGPAAHLFESARALGIPAVSGVHLDAILGRPGHTATGTLAVAVDGNRGIVAVDSW